MLKKTLQFSLLALAALAPSKTDAQIFEGGDDIALIWIGDRHRTDWTKDLFTPYIVHKYEDGHKSWFFDGFLFIDGGYWSDDLKIHYSFGEMQTPILAPKEIWKILLDRQMGTYTGYGVRALDERIGELKAEMGTELSYKHKVIMMTPIAMMRQARNWGDLDGQTLNFEVLADRVKAMSWYVDQVIAKFKEANFQNVELSGIYWLRESMDDSVYEPQLATLVNEYIHSKGLYSYWIPWFNAPYTEKSRELGFDWTYIQPNYVFDMDTPTDRVMNAIDNAYNYDIGLEMEFEGTCISGYDTPTDTRQVVMQSNSSMYNTNPQLFARFKQYIDEFESEGCFDVMPLAYYNGYQAIFDFQNSSSAMDRQLLDRLASLIDKRHIDGGWYTSGISEVETDMRVNIYAVPEGIYIGAGCPAATIYSIDGLTIATTQTGEATTVACCPGIYLVRCGDRTVKVKV